MSNRARRPVYHVSWDGPRVRALRKHLGKTQEEMARELGVRQQTISEWETGVYHPRGASRTLLTLVAERVRFPFVAESAPGIPGEGAEQDRHVPAQDRDNG